MNLPAKNHHGDCNRPLADAALVACPDCDLVQRLPDVPPGASVRCPRCDRELWRHKPDAFNRTFAKISSDIEAMIRTVSDSKP